MQIRMPRVWKHDEKQLSGKSTQRVFARLLWMPADLFENKPRVSRSGFHSRPLWSTRGRCDGIVALLRASFLPREV